MASNILETLLIVFEADVKDIPEKLKDVDEKSEDAAESISTVDDEAKSLKASFGKAAKAAAGFAVALIAVNAVKTAVIQTAQQADTLGKFSDRLNENVELVDAWGQAAVRAGGSAEGFRGSLESLNEKIVETAVKGTSDILPFLNQMGIAFADANGRARSTLDLLPELADSFQNLSAGESAAIGKRLGLDAGTIQLLQQGRSEVEKLIDRQKSLGTITKEQAQLSAEFNDSLADLKQVFQTVVRLMVVEVLPIFTAFNNALTSVIVFLKDHKFFAIAFFSSIAAVVGAVYLPAMLAAAAATLTAIAPFLLIAAAVAAAGAAIALLTDDIYNFLSGNDSVIGEISKKWPIVGEVFEFLKDVMETQFSIMFGIIDKFTEYLENPKQIIQDIIDLFNSIKDFAFGDLASGIGGVLKSIATGDVLVKASEFITGSGSSPANNINSNTIQNSNTRGGDKNVSIGDINVTTPPSAISSEEAGRSAAGVMKNELRTMVDQFDDGVRA